MTLHPRPNTGDASQSLHDLDDLSACAVIYLRLWCDGAEGRAALRRDLDNGLGPRRAAATVEAFETLLTLMARHMPRRMLRHRLGCPCLSMDEAFFARFIATAATGEREDALWQAMLLVRPDQALPLTHAAAAFGLRIAQMLAQRLPKVLH
jgi:hypothetical protein